MDDPSFEGLKKKLAARLRDIPRDRIVFVGVGNRLRGDDGIGPKTIDLLEGRVPHALDVDAVPENFTGIIKRLNPSAIVFIDALDFGSSPGNMRLIEASDVQGYGASTHNLPLDISMEYLRHETCADVFLVGVQPERIGEGEEVSPSLKEPIKNLADALSGAPNG